MPIGFFMLRKIVLASQSLQRLKALQALSIEFEVAPANLDEQAVQMSDPAQRAQKIAQLKAENIASQFPSAIIIAGDTYGFFDNCYFEKPTTLTEAKQMLKKLSGQKFTAYTGFAYLDPKQNIDYSTVKIVQVEMRELSDKEIERYVNTEPVLTWSASFSPAYDSGATLIAKLSGSYTAFTYGIPIEDVVNCLRRSGILI